MATKLTSSGTARRRIPTTQLRGNNTISGLRILNFPTTLRGTAVVPRLPALTRYSRTEPMIWALIRPWWIRSTSLRITTIVGGWEARICSEIPLRTACRRVFYRNSTAPGLYPVVWVEVAKVIVIVATTRALDTLSRCGQITPLWDNLIRHMSGCYLNNPRKSNIRQRVPKVW